MKIDRSCGDRNIFQNVNIYDSLKRSNQYINTRSTNKSVATSFLIKLQKNFLVYVFHNTKIGTLLAQEKTLIVKDIKFTDCPIQENNYDCGLFAFGVLMHLAVGFLVRCDTYNQECITKLRKGLRLITSSPHLNVITDPKKYISCQFVSLFLTKKMYTSIVSDPVVDYYYFLQRSRTNECLASSVTENSTGNSLESAYIPTSDKDNVEWAGTIDDTMSSLSEEIKEEKKITNDSQNIENEVTNHSRNTNLIFL